MNTPIVIHQENLLTVSSIQKKREGSQRKSSVTAETLLDFLLYQNKVEKEKDLKSSNKQQKNPSQLSVVEILELSDEKLSQLLAKDLFFKAKVQMKIKKCAAEKQAETKTKDSQQEEQEQEKGKFITLSILRKKEKENLKKLYQKYIRATQNIQKQKKSKVEVHKAHSY